MRGYRIFAMYVIILRGDSDTTLSVQDHDGESALSDAENQRHYRTLFLSDFHLGTKGCQAGLLLDFLKIYDADTIYLVGDVVDGWRLRRGWYWPQTHNDVIQKLLRKGRKGARLIYIPGNHDEFLRDYVGMTFGAVDIVQNAIHETVDGKRFLVMHGDEFDVVVRHAKWLALLGDWAYVLALGINTYLNWGRRKLGLTYWSLSSWAKMKVKNAVNFIGEFEQALTSEAKRVGADGIICGHIHHAGEKMMGNITYINCGDWVESCTAVVEHFDGRLEIIRYAADVRAAALATEPQGTPVAA